MFMYLQMKKCILFTFLDLNKTRDLYSNYMKLKRHDFVTLVISNLYAFI